MGNQIKEGVILGVVAGFTALLVNKYSGVSV